jgi:Na+-transporting NADH:ubiquinone oxidoreductase subunit NqrF
MDHVACGGGCALSRCATKLHASGAENVDILVSLSVNRDVRSGWR